MGARGAGPEPGTDRRGRAGRVTPWGTDLDGGAGTGPDGRPRRPLLPLMLDDWHTRDAVAVARAATCVSSSLPLVVGVATVPPPDTLKPLLHALTTTLAGPWATDGQRPLVATTDPLEAYRTLAEAVTRRPRASLALGQLLRQTAVLDTVPGLAAEAAVYSMLLGGTEFRTWLSGRDAPRPAADPGRPPVDLRRDGGLLSIRLDRPERRNALSFRMRDELYEALTVAVFDDTVERVELTGAGPAFCSGGDLGEFGTATDPVAAWLARLERTPGRLIDRLRDRLTVRVQGAAVGAGIEMAAFAGRVVAGRDAFFLLPETAMGLVPGAGGTVSVVRRIGRWRAAWMMLGGARVDAATARGWGLADEVTDDV